MKLNKLLKLRENRIEDKNKSRKFVLLGVLIVAIIFITNCIGQDSLNNTDRDDRFKKFLAQYGTEWKIEWNDKTDTPHRIRGGSIKLEENVTRENIENLTRKFISDNKYLLKAEDSSITLAKLDYDKSLNGKDNEGTWYVFYQQKYQNITVYRSSVMMIIKNQHIISFGSDYYSDIEISLITNISEKQAVEIVNQYLWLEEPLEAREVTLIVFPDERHDMIKYHLTWKVEMPRIKDWTVEELIIDNKEIFIEKPWKEWVLFIDAHSGKIVYRYDALVSATISGHVTGEVYVTSPEQPQQEVNIFNQSIHIKQGGVIVDTTATNSNGFYTSGNSLAGDVYVEAYFKGPHVEVHNEETRDPDATHYYGPLTLPTNHDWNWEVDDPSPQDVETNAFYHTNFIHDWFVRGDPFNIEPDPYPMQVYVRDGPYDNAYAGSSGLMFGSGNLYLDFALSVDIIYHEFTHRIVDKVYTTAGVHLPYSCFEGAMNEGWADYFGCSILNDPRNAEVCPLGRNIDTGENKGILPVDDNRRYPRDWENEPHADGLILSGAIWDTRKVLGADYTDNIAMRAMKHSETTFSAYLEAMLEEDDDNGVMGDGTPNIDTICHGFYDEHGIYCEYCMGWTENPVAVITSPSPLEFTLYAHTVNVIGSAARSSSYTMDHFKVEYASESDPATWLTSGITLLGGGITEVIDDTLATWDITGVPDGFYNIRLTVLDDGGNKATSQTTVIIDKHIRDGWPQYTNKYFRYPAASGNIDPDTPEHEIVITCPNDVAAYVFHADGSLYEPWPLSGFGWSNSAPAIGDLDHDGDLEIVISGNICLRAVHHDGTHIFGKVDLSGTDHTIVASPVLWDVDNDNDLEIIMGWRNGNVSIYHHDGTTFTYETFNWPKRIGGAIRATPAVADLDGDSEVEIVVGSEDGNIYAWNLDGSNVAGSWPINIGHPVISSPAIGDIDGDINHDLEIVFGAEDGNAYALHHNGAVVTGSWPVTVFGGGRIWTSPALCDLDNDGDLEILINAPRAHLMVLEHDGSRFLRWGDDLPCLLHNSPVVGDLDGNNFPEIVIGSYAKDSLYALHPDGSSLDGFPKVTAADVNFGAPLITDLDLDGYPEVIVGSKGVYVWSLPNTYNFNAQDWPTFHHEMKRTGYYSPPSGVVLLFDTSGSMSWAYDGTMVGVPESNQRLTLAKEAAYPFIIMLNDFFSGKVNFGIATFPSHPASYPWSCNGEIVTPMTLITDNSKNAAIDTTIPSLKAEDNTPLLAGIETASGMFGLEANKAIILLSDGYHNCPSLVSIGDSEVNNLIEKLKTNSIRVFTIGFGLPSDQDHPLLEEFAHRTTPQGFVGSQFYDVTTQTFDPENWNPSLALQGTYKAILTDALDLETAADPIGIINAGESKIFTVKINEHDRRISFFLSWATSQKDRLGLTVRTSDGQVVQTDDTNNIRFHNGTTYKILTVDKSFLQLPNKVGPNPWKIEINGSELDDGEHENFQYSIILDSGLKMKTALDKASYGTGDTITLTTRITEAGEPIVGLTNVKVNVTQPTEGLGNWFALNNVSAEELNQIPDKIGDENLTPLQRKAIFLTDIRELTFPISMAPVTIRLYDNGSHGDINANDGIYTNEFTNTLKEGTYSFYIYANGSTSGGNSFDRDDVIQKYIIPTVITEEIEIDVKFDRIIEKEKRAYYYVNVTPRDEFGNYLGPGYSGTISLKSSKGEFVDDIKDNLDGTYTLSLYIPDYEKEENININVNVNGAETSFNLADMSDRIVKPNWLLIILFIVLIIIIMLIVVFLFRR